MKYGSTLVRCGVFHLICLFEEYALRTKGYDLAHGVLGEFAEKLFERGLKVVLTKSFATKHPIPLYVS